MIEIKNLVKTFGSVRAVDDLSITINSGINGLIGENGAGKTTMVNLLMKFYEIQSGDIRIDGVSTKDLTREKKLKEIEKDFED